MIQPSIIRTDLKKNALKLRSNTEALETIAWVNPAMMAFVQPFDSFEKIYQNGIGKYQNIIISLQ